MSAPYFVLSPDEPVGREIYIPLEMIEPRSGRAGCTVSAEMEMIKEDLTRIAKIAHALGIANVLEAQLMQIVQEELANVMTRAGPRNGAPDRTRIRSGSAKTQVTQTRRTLSARALGVNSEGWRYVTF
jgi:hypothetical protein